MHAPETVFFDLAAPSTYLETTRHSVRVQYSASMKESVGLELTNFYNRRI